MDSKIIGVTDATLQADVLDSRGLVLVDFWAPWCGPCKAIAPMLEELAGDYAGQIVVAKVNADDNTASSDRFAVRGLPTLILFKDGQECQRVLGVTSKARLSAMVDDHLEA